jgi:hypothetical protein
VKKKLYLYVETDYNLIINTRGGKNIMRKLSIENMEAAKDVKKVDAIVGASFERSKNSEDTLDRSETIVANTIAGWSRLVCWP